MYHFHHTEAIVIAARPFKESDRRLRLFTRDLGIVTATATGVRLAVSKLRYGLQPYACVTVTLVHGKHGWRITNATPVVSFFIKESGRDRSRRTIASLLGFIARFFPEGAIEPSLFDSVRTCCEIVAHGGMSETEESLMRLVCEYKILYTCGYIAVPSSFQSLFADTTVSDMLTSAALVKKELYDAVVQGVAASHL